MDDPVLKRILTEKSKLGFGEFADVTIRSIINARYNYVGWVYYNCKIIDFDAAIKSELDLIEISKPGIAPGMYDAWMKRYGQRFTLEERMHGAAINKAKARGAARARLADANRSTNPSRRILQSINHGHMKNES